MRLVVIGEASPGVIAFGPQAIGILAVGQFATGIIAFGQLATGVIAIGQVARGGIAIGQLGFGLIAGGQVAVGALWAIGIGIAPFAGPGLVFGLFGKLSGARLRAWTNRGAHDRVPFPAWRWAAGTAGTIALAVLWWFGAGRALA